MGEVVPLPNRGEVFSDLRGEGRTLRVSWHSDERTLVLSIWHLGQCRATFRLPSDEVADLVRSLVVAGMKEAEAGTGGSPVALHPTASNPQAFDPDVSTTVAAATPGEEETDPGHTTGAPAAVFLAPPS
jgi:hypothetical protein